METRLEGELFGYGCVDGTGMGMLLSLGVATCSFS